MSDPTFSPFSGQHGDALIAGFFVVALLLRLGRCGGKVETGVCFFLAFVNLSIFALSQWAWSHVQRESDLDNAVPLHLCDLAAITAGFALITGSRTCALLTYFWGLAGTIQGLVTPAIDIGFPHPAFFSFFIHHFAVVAAALYLPVVLGWRCESPWWHSPLKAFAWTNAYALVAIAANHLLGTNFGFLARKPDNPSLLDHLGPHPFYLFWLELLTLLLFLLLALPVRRSRPRPH